MSETPVGEVRVWDVSRDQMVYERTANFGVITSVDSSHDGKLAATTGYDGTVRVWALPSLDPIKVLRGPPGRPNAVCFGRNDNELISLLPDFQLAIRNISSDSIEPIANLGSPIRGLSLSHNSTRLLVTFGENPVSADDGNIQVWDIDRKISTFSTSGRCGCFSSNGQFIAVGNVHGKICTIEIDSGKILETYCESGAGCRCVSFSNGNEYLAAGLSDGTIRVWRLSKKTPIFELRGHTETVCSLSFHPDGRRLASASMSATVGTGKVVLFDLTNGHEAFALEGSFHSLFVGNGDTLLSTATDMFDASQLRAWTSR